MGGLSGAYIAWLAGIGEDANWMEPGASGSSDGYPHRAPAAGSPWPEIRRGIPARFVRTEPRVRVRASPVTHIKTGGPLILLLHGTADESVQSESSGFAELYREAGVQLDQVLIQGASACGSKEVVH
jgi:hypothetical protein